MKLNLGCGSQVPKGWVNVDYAIGARFAKLPFFSSLNKKLNLFNVDWNKDIFIHDLTKKFPWKDNSIDVIYSSHTLEHLNKEKGRYFINECFRVLIANGIVRIVVPDLESIVTRYLNGEIGADEFLDSNELGIQSQDYNNPIKKMLSPLIRFPHKCMYDTATLISVLKEIGFQAEERKAFESDIPDIQQIELKSRTENAVIVEGRKP